MDDRSLVKADGDLFGHKDFVAELAGVVLNTQTPANIALFGAWGSGKSSIANLLEAALGAQRKQVRIVPFDASKYAEAPLRRHFISQVAYGLGIEDEDSDYHRGLYKTTERRDVEFRPKEWGKLIGAAILFLAALLAVLLGLAALVSVLSVGTFKDSWKTIVSGYLLVTVPVSGAILAFIRLAGEGFHVKRTVSAPSGDEEFEKLFRRLVGEAKTERLVVFVDELDRCTPSQVASTLETLKTFLFVPGCVFVVAADQQVLEQALRRKARQHTPEDASNPYYSAGSSYLDKVFQFQLALPPLRSPALTRFALSLVRNKPGIWTRVPRLEEVVSVLIPTHVVSPRRVKVLLNRFAVAYRLAERRAAEGRLDPDVGARATELAKLVCLQSEFPLFAEDLTLDARLPQLVRRVADEEGLPPHVRPEVAERATAYAEGRRIVAEYLVEDEPDLNGGEHNHNAAADADATEENEAEELERPGDSRADRVARRHALQLVAYLRKSQHVDGPGPDLLYLESAGAGHGIDAVLADRLYRAALDNDALTALQSVASAADDGQGQGALRVLADVVSAAPPGVEGRNAVRVLLQGISHSGVELGDHADPIADAVAGHLAKADFSSDDLLGALQLSQASNRLVGDNLLGAVLRHEDASKRPDVAVALLSQADRAHEHQRGALALATRTALLATPGDAASALLSLPCDAAERALDEVRGPLKAASDAHYAAAAAREAGNEYDEDALLSKAPAEALAAGFDATATSEESHAVVRERTAALRVAWLRLMLRLDHKEQRDAVARRLISLAPVQDKDLVVLVLQATRRRSLTEFPRWLASLEPAVAAAPDARQELVAVAQKLWSEATKADAKGVDAAMAALSPLAVAADDDLGLADVVEAALKNPFTTDAMIDQQEPLRARGYQFVDAGLLSRTALANIELTAVMETLRSRTSGIVASTGTKVSGALVDRVREAAPYAGPNPLEDVHHFAKDSDQFVDDAQRANVRIMAASALRRHYPDYPDPVGREALRQLIADVGADDRDVVEAVAGWLATFCSSSADAWHVLEDLSDAPLHESVALALNAYADGLNTGEHIDLLKPAIDRHLTGSVDSSYFTAARLREANASRVADELIERFAAANAEQEWRAVMELWSQLRPTGDATRRKLVEGVYLPLVGKGNKGLDIALNYFGLVSDVRNSRKTIIEALRQAATSKSHQRRVDKVLSAAGWRKKSGLFGLGPEQDKTD